ncbi:MAG: hypothetical protein AAGI30_07055 [Planctomycetota bacterium]
MDIEQLVDALEAITDSIKEPGTLDALKALATAATEAHAALQDAAAMTKFEERIASARTSCQSSVDYLREYPRRTQRLAAELYPRIIPLNIQSRFNNIFSAQPFIIPTAEARIKKLSDDISTQHAALSSLYNKLYEIAHSSSEQNNNNDLESPNQQVHVAVPTEITNDDLQALGKVSRDWALIANSLEEYTTGSKPKAVRVTSLSKGSFEFSFSMSLEGAFAILLLTQAVVKILQTVKKNRERIDDAREDGYTDDVINQMQEQDDLFVQKGKDQVIRKLEQRYDHIWKSSESKARGNELLNGCRNSLNRVLSYINSGSDIDVSHTGTAEEEDAVESDIQSLRDQIDKLRLEVEQRFDALGDRSSPILVLPEATLSGGESDSNTDAEQSKPDSA